MRSRSAVASSRRTSRSRRRSSSSLAVSSSIPSVAARASSSASSGTSSSSGSPGSSRCSRARRCSSASKCSGESSASSSRTCGCAATPASASRSSRKPFSSRRGLISPGRAPAAARREAGLRLLGQVEPVGREPNRVLALRRVLEAREHLAHADEGLLPVGRPLDLEPHAVGEVALRPAEQLVELAGEVGRVAPGRQRHDADVEPLRRRELHPAQRRRLAGRVAVEAEPRLVRQARELLQLPLGERGAHRGDDRLEPGLVQREHVGVALDHDRALLLRDRRPRAVEAVEQVALAEELALGRVDVLGAQRVVLAQLPRLEPAHAPARVGQREEQAPVEVVVARGGWRGRLRRSSCAVNPFSRAFRASVAPPGASPSRNSRQTSSPRPRLSRYARAASPRGDSQR